MSKKRTALGRGLSALLSDAADEQDMGRASSGGMAEIALSEITTNPYQPREKLEETALQELAESIKVHGIIQPITVRRLARGQYQLIAGERRFRAAQRAGLKSVPAFVRSADDQQMLEMALIENIQRENLNAIEIALSYQRLITECNLKQDQLGGRVGKDRSTVTNYLRLLKLPPDIQIAVRDGRISMGHARALINVDNPAAQLAIFKKILSEDLSVRQAEALARNALTGRKEKPAPATVKPSFKAIPKDITRLQSRLSSHFGTKVNVKSDGRKGEIKIPFLSVEELNRILDILKIGW
jgi:ParB family chromosome partitioning protein